jgi:hypothetical protein
MVLIYQNTSSGLLILIKVDVRIIFVTLYFCLQFYQSNMLSLFFAFLILLGIILLVLVI